MTIYTHKRVIYDNNMFVTFNQTNGKASKASESEDDDDDSDSDKIPMRMFQVQPVWSYIQK